MSDWADAAGEKEVQRTGPHAVGLGALLQLAASVALAEGRVCGAMEPREDEAALRKIDKLNGLCVR